MSTSNVIRVSNSEVETYRQCRLKHQLQYIELWRTEEESEALARGTLFHSVMEEHYRQIEDGLLDAEDPWLTLYAAVGDLLFDPATGEQSERQELVEWMYRGYVEQWKLDPNWRIEGIEVPVEMELGDGFVLKGTCDLVVYDRAMDGLWIVDHKTCKYLPKKDFDLEDQTAVYTHLLKKAGMDIRGAIYNHVRTDRLKTKETPMEDRFKRTITVRTDRELETCANEVLELMQEAYSNHEARRGVGEVYDAPRSPNADTCGWKCNLTEACLAGRKYGPERTRTFLGDTGFTIHETKPGPTFNKPERAGA